MKKKPGPGNELKTNDNDFGFLKNLANSLAEIITEKELALQNQLRINKELMRKIQATEDNKQRSHIADIAKE